MNETEILTLFSQGFDCSQIVLSEVRADLNLDDVTAKKVTACFGGGMFCAETCGAVTAALMAIGLKYGHCMPNATADKNKAIEKSMKFKSKFLEKYPSLKCKEILGYDLSNADEMEIITEKNLILNICPKLVIDTIVALKNTL
ncbi:C-GCAxxG-C-C family protein [Clostridium algidicarnis]|uniref:C-GCAxxG-C-C family protein n=1 Tax=Clostridium algidicarnis TaxID=37659 RepID=UPI001C0C97BA|nr:C-GCAxxG-C-C family protein [Clostridium algidicarnis]MBU3209722.1 C-GCAxxG-C-C family protein [Clostridium algidicarnis]